jgi:predicted lipid-binding transport protein (Tim44 family)
MTTSAAALQASISAPSQNAALRLVMEGYRAPEPFGDLRAMPEIDLPTVIFALVALFVAYKLRSVLGLRNDSERPPGGLLAPLRRAPGPASSAAPVEPPQQAGPSAPAPAADRWTGVADLDAWRGLDAIVAADRTFTPEGFLSGARAAYEIIVHAFAAGDAAALRGLMTPEAFANFDNAIRARAATSHTMSTTVVSIDGSTIVGAQLVGSNAQVSVRFASKLASVTRDAAGTVVEGSPTEVLDHLDLWTFVRDVRSRDPNWQLTATQAER